MLRSHPQNGIAKHLIETHAERYQERVLIYRDYLPRGPSLVAGFAGNWADVLVQRSKFRRTSLGVNIGGYTRNRHLVVSFQVSQGENKTWL